MQEIRLNYFFLPIRLQVQSNPGGEHVMILQPTMFGTFEFIRLPVHDAHQLAELLETSAENATATPLVAGTVGEINGIFERALGTGQIRIRLSVKRSDSVRLRIRTSVGSMGRKTGNSTPRISAEEARRFANVLREANAVFSPTSR